MNLTFNIESTTNGGGRPAVVNVEPYPDIAQIGFDLRLQEGYNNEDSSARWYSNISPDSALAIGEALIAAAEVARPKDTTLSITIPTNAVPGLTRVVESVGGAISEA